MVVIFNAVGNSRVVISPFDHGDHAIVVFVTEVSEELKEGFVICDFSRANFWVSLTFECNSKIRSGDRSGRVCIELQETFLNASNSGIVKLSSKARKEQIVVDNSIIVCVQSSHEAFNLIFV